MAQQIQIRRGSAAAWLADDPILAQGELGYETDTFRFKIGDGATAWSALSFFSAGGTAIVVQEGDSTVVTTASVLDFGTGFDVTESPSGEANIALDLTEYSGGALPVAGGGTGATSASAARTALGIQETLIIPIGDESTAITTGTAKVTFRMPFALTVTAVRASLTTASSSGTPTFDINEGGTSILSTKLTIDANEKTSTTAATAAVISDTALADDAEITIDVDVAGTSAAGAKIYIIGTR